MALRSPLTLQPYDYIGDSTGRPLDKGQIYIGVAGQDPEFYQIPIYLDAAMTRPIDQPIRTNDGFVDFSGSLSELYASGEIYSVKILDKEGRTVLYKGDMTRKNLMSDALAGLNQSIVDAQSAAQAAIDDTINNASIVITNVSTDATAAIDNAVLISNDAASRADSAIQDLFESGGLPARPFTTYAKMIAPDVDPPLADGDYAIVTNDSDLSKNGVYQKLNGVFVYSKYNLQPQISAIATQLTSEKNPPLRNLYNDLNNPLMNVKIKLVGDSITWGVGASGARSSTPRTGRLTDPRNTTDAAISPSWANLLNRYLLTTYSDGDIVRNAVGVTYAESATNIFFSRDAEFFSFRNTATNQTLSADDARKSAAAVNVGGGEWFSLFSKTYPADDAFDEISFDANGMGFDLVYTKLIKAVPTGAFINIYIDNVFYKKVDFFATTGGYNFIESVVLPNDGKHRITIRNESTVDAIAKLQYIKTIKRVTVANDGISGSTTNSWLTAVTLAQSIQPNDDYVFIMLGTNDRIRNANNSEIGYSKNLLKMINDISVITGDKASVIMVSASAVTNDENPTTSNFFMTMRAVNNTIKNIANSKGLSFISNYEATQQYKADGTSFLADGLHPNDFGHRAIFDNIKNAIVKN